MSSLKVSYSTFRKSLVKYAGSKGLTFPQILSKAEDKRSSLFFREHLFQRKYSKIATRVAGRREVREQQQQQQQHELLQDQVSMLQNFLRPSNIR
jgi:hypothetical protein